MPGPNAKMDPGGVLRFKSRGFGSFRFFSRAGSRSSGLSAPVVIDGEQHAEVTVQLYEGALAVILVTDAGGSASARLWVLDERDNDFSRTLGTFDYARYVSG
jgi:hypothetical protein